MIFRNKTITECPILPNRQEFWICWAFMSSFNANVSPIYWWNICQLILLVLCYYLSIFCVFFGDIRPITDNPRKEGNPVIRPVPVRKRRLGGLIPAYHWTLYCVGWPCYVEIVFFFNYQNISETFDHPIVYDQQGWPKKNTKKNKLDKKQTKIWSNFFHVKLDLI